VKMPWRREAAARPDPGPDPRAMSPALLTWVDYVDGATLSEKTARTAERFLRDYRHMHSLAARRETALRLRAAIEAQLGVPAPATVSSMDVIAAAVSARRRPRG
jgi:hypothetical protein